MRVGTRAVMSLRQKFCQDHPHACGDKGKDLRGSQSPSGSSPCVWGQVLPCCNYLSDCRIIPMRVGTSICHLSIIRIFQDHPHACGDKTTITLRCLAMLGSSPCVWGQGFADGLLYTLSGIIPMRVGTSNGNVVPAFANEDHPHACGDKISLR